MFFDKFALLYEPMEEWEVQELTWHGLSILKLTPKVTTSSQPRRNVNGKGVMEGVVPNSLEAARLRARTRSARRPQVPSALPVPSQDPFSTFAPIDGGIKAHEVPLTVPIPLKPTVRIFMPKAEASVPFPNRNSLNPKKVRPIDFQKRVKKFNEMGDPYVHLTNFHRWL